MLGKMACTCMETGSSLEFIGWLASPTCRGSGKWENLGEILSQAKEGRNVRRDPQGCALASTYMSTHVDVHICTHIHSHTCMGTCMRTLTHTHTNYKYKIVFILSLFHCLPYICTLYIVWSFPQACFCQLAKYFCIAQWEKKCKKDDKYRFIVTDSFIWNGDFCIFGDIFVVHFMLL